MTSKFIFTRTGDVKLRETGRIIGQVRRVMRSTDYWKWLPRWEAYRGGGGVWYIAEENYREDAAEELLKVSARVPGFRRRLTPDEQVALVAEILGDTEIARRPIKDGAKLTYHHAPSVLDGTETVVATQVETHTYDHATSSWTFHGTASVEVGWGNWAGDFIEMSEPSTIHPDVPTLWRFVDAITLEMTTPDESRKVVQA